MNLTGGVAPLLAWRQAETFDHVPFGQAAQRIAGRPSAGVPPAILADLTTS